MMLVWSGNLLLDGGRSFSMPPAGEEVPVYKIVRREIEIGSKISEYVGRMPCASTKDRVDCITPIS
jgi:hypothetical protein